MQVFTLSKAADHLVDLGLADARQRGQRAASVPNVVLAALHLGEVGPLGALFDHPRVVQALTEELLLHVPMRRTAKPGPVREVRVSGLLERLLGRVEAKGPLTVRHVLRTLCTEEAVRGVLEDHGVTIPEALATADESSVVARDRLGRDPDEAVPRRAPAGALDATSASGGYLERFGRDLTAMAKEGLLQRAIGRGEEVLRIRKALLRLFKNNPLLIGEPGTGKTAIVEHLAILFASGEVDPSLEGVRVVEIDLPGLVAGTRFRGDFEERIKGVLEEIREARGSVIPFIDEVHLLVGAGSTEGGMDAANILKPALARGELRLIAATTPDEYRRSIEKDGALARRFDEIFVPEPSPEDTLQILRGVRSRLRSHHDVEIPDEACERAVTLAEQTIRHRFFPDKAIMVLDEACALFRAERPDESTAKKNLLVDHVDRAVEHITGIPATRLSESGDQLRRVERGLRERVIGQDRAVDAVLSTLTRLKAGTKHPDRPIGSLLFVGPSGVGKTELARVIAEEFFHQRDALVRFDMSEVGDHGGASFFLGAAGGLVGFEQGGALTNALRTKPYAVYLFDEIEKADRESLDIFLQMLEDGRLTGRDHRTVDCSNTLVVFTSNLGLSSVVARRDATLSERRRLHTQAVEAFLRPELLARLDDVVVFDPLNDEAMQGVARLLLHDLGRRFARAHRRELRFDDGVAAWVGDATHDPTFGARSVRRFIAQRIERDLATWIVENAPITTSIRVRLADGATVFSAEEAA